MDSLTSSPLAPPALDGAGTPDARRPYVPPVVESAAQTLPALLASNCGQPGTPSTPGCDFTTTPTG